MSRDTIIVTRRLRLRNWKRKDLDAFHTHCNTQEVMAYLGGRVTKRTLRREIAWYQHHQIQHGHSFWVIERKCDKAFLGFCGIIEVSERKTPIEGKLEIGWRVRADMWGRGYAYEAAVAVIDWAEWELPAQTLYARIHQDNVASQALARKLGMRRARSLEARQSSWDRELLVFRLRV